MPEWLSLDEVRRLIALEAEDDGRLAPLPVCFFEIAHMLVRDAKEDVVDCDQLKTLVQDLWDKREAKLRTSVQSFVKQRQQAFAKMNNVSALELTAHRAPLLAATKEIDRLVANLHLLSSDQ